MWIVTPHKWHMKWQGFWQNWKMSFFTIAIQSMEHSITFHFSPPDREYFCMLGDSRLVLLYWIIINFSWWELHGSNYLHVHGTHLNACIVAKLWKKNHQQANACSCLRLLLQELTVDNNSIRWQPIFVVQSAAL